MNPPEEDLPMDSPVATPKWTNGDSAHKRANECYCELLKASSEVVSREMFWDRLAVLVIDHLPQVQEPSDPIIESRWMLLLSLGFLLGITACFSLVGTGGFFR